MSGQQRLCENQVCHPDPSRQKTWRRRGPGSLALRPTLSTASRSWAPPPMCWTGWERLELLHGILHPEGGKFAFDWNWLAPSGLSVKDFIAPSSFHFGETRTFRIGEMYGAVSFLQITAPEIHDRILTEFMETEGNILVTMHIRGINQNEAIKMVKRKITDLDAMKIAEQKRAVRSGYDMDILPSDLATYGGAAKSILQDLQSRNERML